MPAKAPVIRMVQFNGYHGCSYCFEIDIHHNHRMLYPVNTVSRLRTIRDFHSYGRKAQRKKKMIFGFRGFSPLNNIFAFPWDAPVDAMHQIFLGTAKVLVKGFINRLRSEDARKLDEMIQLAKVPSEFLHKPKSLAEINYWKAADFKLFFFHLGPLLLRKLTSVKHQYYESFCTLVLAVRLLSERVVNCDALDAADDLISRFYTNFDVVW